MLTVMYVETTIVLYLTQTTLQYTVIMINLVDLRL